MRNHATVLNKMIDEVLVESSITLETLSAIAVCGGPGSYTGLRIGLATAKAFCYVLDKPLLLDDKLTLLAWQQYHKNLSKYEFYVSVLPAREKEYYISTYNSEFVCLTKPQHAFEEVMKAIVTALNGEILMTGISDLLTESILSTSKITSYEIQTIDMYEWALYAFEGYSCNRFVILSTSEPYYLKQVYINK